MSKTNAKSASKAPSQNVRGAEDSSSPANSSSKPLQLLNQLVERWSSGQDYSDLRAEVNKLPEVDEAYRGVIHALLWNYDIGRLPGLLRIKAEFEQRLLEEASRPDLTVSEGLFLHKIMLERNQHDREKLLAEEKK